MLLLLLPPSVFPCASASSIAFDAQHLLHMFEVLDELGGMVWVFRDTKERGAEHTTEEGEIGQNKMGKVRRPGRREMTPKTNDGGPMGRVRRERETP